MNYVVMRQDGKYVTRAGSASSYTSKLQKARVYPTLAAAQQDKCGNERVVSLVEAMGHA